MGNDHVNRKRFHSLDVQAVCNPNGKFTNIVARWPGLAHDSWILKQSQLWEAFESGQIEGTILGYSGYPCQPWLFTDPQSTD